MILETCDKGQVKVILQNVRKLNFGPLGLAPIDWAFWLGAVVGRRLLSHQLPSILLINDRIQNALLLKE